MRKNHFRIVFGAILFVSMIMVNYSCDSEKSTKTVLFDEGHGQLFKTGDTEALSLSKLSDIFLNDGWIVKTSHKEITDENLLGIDALVISGAFKSISKSETKAIVRYLEKGGKLSVMLHIGPPVSDLLHAMDVSISNGVIHEQGNVIIGNDIDFKVRDLKDHELTKNLNEFSIYGGWALLPTKQNAYVVAQTTEKAWIDLNGDNKADAQQNFATVVVGTVGSGEFVVFSDDAIFQNNFLEENNLILAQNLATWLSE